MKAIVVKIWNDSDVDLIFEPINPTLTDSDLYCLIQPAQFLCHDFVRTGRHLDLKKMHFKWKKKIIKFDKLSKVTRHKCGIMWYE